MSADGPKDFRMCSDMMLSPDVKFKVLHVSTCVWAEAIPPFPEPPHPVAWKFALQPLHVYTSFVAFKSSIDRNTSSVRREFAGSDIGCLLERCSFDAAKPLLECCLRCLPFRPETSVSRL